MSEMEEDEDVEKSTTSITAVSSGEEEAGKDPKSKEQKPKQKQKSRKKRILTINLTNCKYDSVRRVSRKFGLKPVGEDEDWTVFWTDTAVMLERVMDMKRYQKINHFPGMIEICRKDLLARNMNRMLKLFPKDYSVFPRSWCMPADFGDFQSFYRTKKSATFICKPESGCQGKGIFVFKNIKDIKVGEHCVIQQYLSKPFIMDGFKFDLRIYVLVTSCDPLRIYVYKDGLGRFATVKYHDPTCTNVSEQCMHLTNYAINKTSKDFIRDDDTGSKRRISTVNQWFIDNGYNIKKIWADIEDVIIKTLIAAHPILKHNYRSCFPNHNRGSACFEILGFDVLLDKKLKPWLIEVNHSPSFHTDAPLDKEVKEGLLSDTLNLIDLYANDKRKCMEEDKKRVKERLLLRQKSKDASQSTEANERAKYELHLERYEQSHLGGFRRIYPQGNEERYAMFFDQSTSLCAETVASRARIELARLQREDIEARQKESENYRKRLSGAKPVGKNEDEIRPESPTSEKKNVIKRRGASYRIPLYTNDAGVRAKEMEAKGDTNKEQKDIELPILPYGTGVSPQAIREDEELERLAGMQLRDSLVRGLGVTEQLQASLVLTSRPPSTYCNYTNQGENSRGLDPIICRTESLTFSIKNSGIPIPLDYVNQQQPLSIKDCTHFHSFSKVKTANWCGTRTYLKQKCLPLPQTPVKKSTPPYHRNLLIKRSTHYLHDMERKNARSGLQKRLLSEPSKESELFGLSVTSAPIRLASRTKPSDWNQTQSILNSGTPKCHQPKCIQRTSSAEFFNHNLLTMHPSNTSSTRY